MASQFSTVRSKERLEIALATDTVLYLPFYLAYYSNDFCDTPSSDLEVVIIGTKNDFRFNQNKKLKGDGFATFSVLLGLADAAICDPSYLVYLNNCEDDSIKKQLNSFQSLLKIDTKKDICKDFDPILSECLEVINDELVFKDLPKFKIQILRKYTRVIGGLVSKIAFLAVGSEDFKRKAADNIDKSLGRIYKEGNLPSEFGIDNLHSYLFHYESPSTGFCIGKIYSDSYRNNSKTSIIKSKKKDFGCELKYLSEKTFIKHNNTWKENPNRLFCRSSISLSCDYISIDFMLDKHNDSKNPRIVEVEDLAYDCTSNYMFTGIIGNTKPENSEKLKALLYGIDYNLFKITSYLKKSDTTGLIQYLKTKLKYDDEKQDIVLNLLIADESIKEYIKYQINNKSTTYSFESVLKYFVDRLREWKQVGNLYYPNTIPIEKDLEAIAHLRFKSSGKNSQNEIKYKDFLYEDLLDDYREDENKFFLLEKQALYKAKWEKWLIVFAPVLLINAIVQMLRWLLKSITGKSIRIKLIQRFFLPFEVALWYFVRRPIFLYLMGSLFILLEITSSMFHIFHFPGLMLDKLNHSHIVRELVPGSLTEHYSVIHTINIGEILFGIFFIYLVAIFFSFRQLSQFKQDGKYFYRNE